MNKPIFCIAIWFSKKIVQILKLQEKSLSEFVEIKQTLSSLRIEIYSIYLSNRFFQKKDILYHILIFLRFLTVSHLSHFLIIFLYFFFSLSQV